MLNEKSPSKLDQYYNRKYGDPIEKYDNQITILTKEEEKEISNLTNEIACIKWILKERKEKKTIKKIKFNLLGTIIELEEG